MTSATPFDSSALKTIFHECNQCGTCCRQYRKITLKEDEIDFIKQMGGHVGTNVSMEDIRLKGFEQATAEARAGGKIFMIHPDEQGCIFLQKRNDKYYCKIYNYRPQACRGFKCNLADGTFLSLFGRHSIHLLGQNDYGLPLEDK